MLVNKNTFNFTCMFNRGFILLFFLNIVFFLFFYNKNFVLMADSYSYLSWSPQRPFLYPLFLDICRFLFDDDFLQAAFITGLLLLGASVLTLYCSVFLVTRNQLIALLCGSCAFLPLNYDRVSYITSIMSEQIVYPLSLFLFSAIIVQFKRFTKTSMVLVYSLFFLMICGRSQLTVFAVLVLGVPVSMFFRNEMRLKCMVMHTGLIMVLILAANYIDHNFRLHHSGIYTGNNAFYYSLATMAFYHSNFADLENYKSSALNREDAERAEEIFKTIEGRKLNKHSGEFSRNRRGLYAHYTENWDKIQWEVITPLFFSVNDKNNENIVRGMIARESFSKNYFLFFLKNRWPTVLSAIVTNIYGSYFTPEPYFGVLIFLFLVGLLIVYVRNKTARSDYLLSACLSLYLFFVINTILCAALVYMESRLLVYGNLALMISLFLAVSRVSPQSKNTEAPG